MSNIILLIILAIGSYFLGGINWALIISKLKNKDIRNLGSGNPGTLNMSRNFGLGLGLLTLFLDMLKGAVPTLITFFVFNGKTFLGSDFYIFDFAIYLSGLCAILGHIFPIYLKFKGGKGIATTIGVLTVIECVHGITWAVVVIMALVGAVCFIYFTEFGAMGSFIAITPSAISGLIRLYLTYAKVTDKISVVFYIISNVLVLAICFFTWFAHRKNIERMLSGDEHPTSIKEMVVKHRIKKLRQKVKEKRNNQKKVEL